MISISECCKKYSIKLKHIKRWNNYIILYGENGNYLLKEKDNDKEKLYSTLESIQYPYYLPLLNSYQDSYELYSYYEEEVYDNNIKSFVHVVGFDPQADLCYAVDCPGFRHVHRPD